MNDECLRDVVRDHAKITLIVRELQRQDCLEQQLNELWAKMHRVRRRHTEPQAQEEIIPTDKETFSVAQSSGSLQNLTILSKEKQTRSVVDVDSSNAAKRKNEETKSESIAHTNDARVTRSTSAWKASYWGGEDSDDDCDDLVGDHEGTAHRRPRRNEWCKYSSDEDDEKDDIWNELDSDDDSFCPYQPLTLEEALRQIEEGKKTRLDGKKTDNPTLHESRCGRMSGPVFGEWVNGGTESLRPACEVGSGKIRVASVCFERRIQLTDQKSLVIEPNEIRTGSVAVLYWKVAESREMKVMVVDRVKTYRAKMTPERCSSNMMPIQETLMRKNEAAEPSLVFNVSPGDAIVQRVWVEYDVEMTVQMNHVNWSERGLIESAVIRLNREAAAADVELMSAERT